MKLARLSKLICLLGLLPVSCVATQAEIKRTIEITKEANDLRRQQIDGNTHEIKKEVQENTSAVIGELGEQNVSLDQIKEAVINMGDSDLVKLFKYASNATVFLIALIVFLKRK